MYIYIYIYKLKSRDSFESPEQSMAPPLGVVMVLAKLHRKVQY